ncbi:MAG: hypothetical protein Q8R02_23365 [Hyphomonadaceae bacterium]|nr:hypothetical protein [Hyphomonadaceae bacterium]
MIATLSDIIETYMDQGYTLTVRQLYYQVVARDILPNNTKSYNRIKSLVNDARLAGLLDWDAIEDRTREFVRRARWESGSDILQSVAQQYHMDRWVGQTVRPFVIVEKEALVGVLERVCHEYDVPLLAARGYPSVSVLRAFVQSDILPVLDGGQGVMLLHLGDHDPSGIDMTRDLQDRLQLLQHGNGECWTVQRLALNMKQVEEKSPPPNPAKTTDARFEGYRVIYGDESWELDALEPAYLHELVENHVMHCIDKKKAWKARAEEIDAIKTRLSATAADWARPQAGRR